MMKALWIRIKLVATIVLVMIFVFALNQFLLEGALYQYGVIPGQTDKWFHVFTAPFIHGDISHLINNLISFSLFSSICLIRSVRYFSYGSFFIIAVSGLLVWWFARGASHIGASGWIFGLWAMTIASAWFEQRFIPVLTSVGVLFFYGGMIYGVLPSDPRISFEMHFFGVLSGVLFAFLYARISRKSESDNKSGKSNKVIS